MPHQDARVDETLGAEHDRSHDPPPAKNTNNVSTPRRGPHQDARVDERLGAEHDRGHGQHGADQHAQAQQLAAGREPPVDRADEAAARHLRARGVCGRGWEGGERRAAANR